MSKLVAEKRTDKNGVERTYWVRPNNSTASGKKKLPAPTATSRKAPFTDTAAVLKLLRKSMDFYAHKGMPESIDEIRKYRPETLDLAIKLASTGSKQARKEAITDFLNCVSALTSNIPYGRTPLKEVVVQHAGFDTQVRMLSAWHAYNAIEESGLDLSYDDSKRVRTGVWDAHYYGHKFGSGEAGDENTLPTEAYWRGSAALSIVRIDERLQNRDEAKDIEFMMWAGAQEDLGAVITLAKERGTDVEELEAILSQTSGHSSLYEGRL